MEYPGKRVNAEDVLSRFLASLGSNVSFNPVPLERLQDISPLFFETWRDLNPTSERGTIVFETRGTPVHVQMKGRWSAGPREPFVGLSGNPNKVINGFPHMCVFFVYEWTDEDGQRQNQVFQGTGDEYSFTVDSEVFPAQQIKLTVVANDSIGQFGNNINHPTEPAQFRTEYMSG